MSPFVFHCVALRLEEESTAEHHFTELELSFLCFVLPPPPSYLPPSSSDSELQIALVALFSEMLYRFPNVVVAQVTRESVQQAIANGITAQQV